MRVQVSLPAPENIKQTVCLAYIVGIALGDGNLSCPNGRATRLRITCDSKYPKIAKEIIKNLKSLFPNNKVSIYERTKTYFDISVYSNQLNVLMPWVVGMGSKKVQNASVPDWIKKNKDLTRHCLRGLIQTDGCIYQDRGYTMITFTNNTKKLSEDVQSMMVFLGFNPSFSDVNNRGFRKYTVRIARKTEVEDLIKQIGLYKS